ncbi:hypothetical protein [Sphingomonas sp. MMS24-J13]|uniref:hypothetical protein n=1 Tax=Sphingomonas sp. MMS24-J13 TaxID=3238686 RepID=UPI00384C13B8
MLRTASGPALFAALLAIAAPSSAAAPVTPYGGLPTAYSYVALADMALASPIVLAADIADAIPIKDQAGVPTGKTRYYIDAEVKALISGHADLPLHVTYQVDIPADPRSKKAKLKGVPVLLLAATTATPGMLRLIGPDAQVPRTPENEARIRAILAAAVAPDAPPVITGITRAFHVAGTLPGESETQIFVRTADARPISLNILRRPGEKPRWAVALTELVDASAAPPPPDSLLWYRLACGLPRQLPDAAVDGQAPADADAARADYALVLAGLGTCRAA